MKAQLIIIVLVWANLSSFAQSSRRDEQNNDNKRGSERKEQSRDQQRSQGNSNGNRREDNHNQVSQENRGNNNSNANHGNQGNQGNHTSNNVYQHDRSNNDRYDHNRNDWDRSHWNDHVVTYDVRRPQRTDRYYRDHVVYRSTPLPVRRVHYDYRIPVRNELIWSFELNRDYRRYYPEIASWRYNVGAHVRMIPAYDSWDNIGEVNTVYGKVVDSFYDNASDQYYFYFGETFPNQNFSVVIPGVEARQISRRPEDYFIGQNMSVTGYISRFDNRPEIVVRNARQVEVY